MCLLPFLSFPFLSCTAPDKQHQKQHSHQPQRKHPFTCSGIYLLTPPSPMFVCVCRPQRPSVPQQPYLHPLPGFPTLSPLSVFLSVRVFGCCLLSLTAAMPTAVGKVLNQQVVSGNISPWQVGMLSDLYSGWYCAALSFSLSVKVCQRRTDSQCLPGLSVRFTPSLLFMPL